MQNWEKKNDPSNLIIAMSYKVIEVILKLIHKFFSTCFYRYFNQINDL